MFFFLTYFTLYNGLQFHPSQNWFKCILFNSWVIFHCVCLPWLSYPFVCWWTSRLLPCPGYYKQCCDEHRGTRASFSSGFLVEFPGGLEGKASACSAGEPGSVHGLGRSPREGNDNPLQYSCLEKFHARRSLVGYSPWNRKESDITERLHFHFRYVCPGAGLLGHLAVLLPVF